MRTVALRGVACMRLRGTMLVLAHRYRSDNAPSSLRSFAELRKEFQEQNSSKAVDEYPPRQTNMGINIVHQGFTAVVERLGKLHAIRDPGLFFAIPIIDQIVAVHDMREMCLPVPRQTATTQDNVRINLEGNVYVKILDPEKATYKVRRPLFAVLRHAEAAMRSSVGLMELDNIFHSRATLNAHTLGHLQEACANWGVSVTRYEVTSVDPDPKISESMDLQAAAERKRRETVKTAMAEKEAAVLQSEGQREKDRNEAEGKKIRAITEAEGFRAEQTLRAEGLKQAKILEAQGLATALEVVGRVAQTEHGQRALQYMFGKEYIGYMSHLGSQTNSTIFMPQDVGDISAVLAKGLALLNSNAFGRSNNPRTGGTPPAVVQADPEFDLHQTGISSDESSSPVSSEHGKWDNEMQELKRELDAFGNLSERDRADAEHFGYLPKKH